MRVIDEGADLFPHYAEEGGASAEEVDGAADEILRPTGMLQEVDSEIDASHGPAAASTGGFLSPLLEDAPKDTKDRISKVLATSLVASGATRLFGQDGIAAYDGLVDDLRTEYRERKAEILASDCGIEKTTYPDDATSAEREQEHGTVYEHEDGSITVTESDRSRLFTVIATDDTAATTLSTTIGAYEQTRLDAAIESGDAAEMQDVGAETNRLDGYMAAGLYNADAIGEHGKYESEMDAYEEHMQAAAVGKAIVTGGLGAIPEAGSPISAGAGLLYDEIIKDQIPMPEEPEAVRIPGNESDHFLRTVMAYEYVSAQLRAGHDLPAEIDDMLEDGKLPPIADMGSTKLSELDTHLADDEGYLDYVEKFEGSDPYDTTKIDGDPEGYLNGKD